MTRVGIDFGTTNTSIFYTYNGNDNSLIKNSDELTVESCPSLIEIIRENGNITCKYGYQLLSTHIKNITGKAKGGKVSYTVVKSMKTILGDDSQLSISGINKWESAKKYFTLLLNDANKNMIGSKIDEVVLSKPIDFSPLYAEQLKKCVESIRLEGSSTNLRVVAVIDEPVAIAINGLRGKSGRCMVVDIGGGTTDITLLEKNRDKVRVLANDGLKIAGDYIDRELGLEIQKLAGQDILSKEVTANSNYMELRKAKEEMEKNFANGESDELVSINLSDETDRFNYNLDPLVYKNVIFNSFIKRLREKCDKFIESNSLSRKNLDFIILAGGTMNSFILKRWFKEFYGKQFEIIDKRENKRIATALGNLHYSLPNTQNILNHSYSCRLFDDVKNVNYLRNMFFRNEEIPTQWKSQGLVRVGGSSYDVELKVYQGEEINPNKRKEYDIDNQQELLGKSLKYVFTNEVKVGDTYTFRFRFDENGIMQTEMEFKGEIRKQSLMGLL